MKENILTYQVYRHLGSGEYRGTLSIRDKLSKLVVGHCSSILIANPQFKSSKAGVERIRRTKNKSVVGWVEGECLSPGSFQPFKGRTSAFKVFKDKESLDYRTFNINYNPYRSNEFYMDGYIPARDYDFDYVKITSDGVITGVNPRLKVGFDGLRSVDYLAPYDGYKNEMFIRPVVYFDQESIDSSLEVFGVNADPDSDKVFYHIGDISDLSELTKEKSNEDFYILESKNER